MESARQKRNNLPLPLTVTTTTKYNTSHAPKLTKLGCSMIISQEYMKDIPKADLAVVFNVSIKRINYGSIVWDVAMVDIRHIDLKLVVCICDQEIIIYGA